MLSWEFPPKVVGGIAPHVHDLSLALVKKGLEVTVITAGIPESKENELVKGVSVHRVQPAVTEAPDFLSRVIQLNLNMVEKAVKLHEAGERFDLIHVHDWLAVYAGKLLKHAWKRPMVATIHATEWGRNNGLHNELQRYISNMEWWLGFEAWRVICCSRYMFHELRRVFQLPGDKLRIIPNGIYPKAFRETPINPAEVRGRFAAPDEKIIFSIGRLVIEKGLDLLLEATPRIIAGFPKVKLVIAGRGPYSGELKEKAKRLGIYHRIYFTGYIDDPVRNALFQTAAVAVFPSFYEPFGIVALEAMAAGTPLVVSDTGGLGEIVHHGRNGLKVFNHNPDSLADSILWMLYHPAQAEEMKKEALQDIKTIYNWEKIAGETISAYEEVYREYTKSTWKRGVEETIPDMVPSPYQKDGFFERNMGLKGFRGEGEFGRDELPLQTQGVRAEVNRYLETGKDYEQRKDLRRSMT